MLDIGNTRCEQANKDDKVYCTLMTIWQHTKEDFRLKFPYNGGVPQTSPPLPPKILDSENTKVTFGIKRVFNPLLESIKWGNWLHQSIELQCENLWFRFGAKRHLKYTFPSISKLVANSWSNFWYFASSVSVYATEMFIVECCCGIQFRDLFNIKLRSGRQSRLTPVMLFGPRSWKCKNSSEY